MPNINILPPSVFNLISAGEVVERPASVVKELVENSIDAGSNNITISLLEGGLKQIVIIDDGCGMSKENLHKCILPHSTSKLNVADDLNSISTLGFRGEALASICAVSQLSIHSKQANNNYGYYVVYHGGQLVEEGQTAVADGTKITIDNLFFNTPVRAKFLKSIKQEQNYVQTVVVGLMLANPNIKFKFICDNKTILQTNGGLEECIYTIFDTQLANQLIAFDRSIDNYRLYGYVGNKHTSRSNRNHQYIIINGRVVSDNTVQTAVAQAYGNSLMTRQYPVFVLNIVMPFDSVDVNVHPNKNQVRFDNNNKVFSAVYRTISNILIENDKIAIYQSKNNNIPTSNDMYTDNHSNIISVNNVNNIDNNDNKPNNITNLDLSKDMPKSGDIHPNNQPNVFVNSNSTNNFGSSSPKNANSFDIDNYFADNNKTNNDKQNKTFNPNNHIDNNLDNDTQNKDLTKDNPANKIFNIDSLLKNKQSQYSNFSTNKHKNFAVENSTIFDEIVLSDNNLISDINQVEQLQLEIDTNINIVGQIFNTYLVVEYDNKAYLIDQHACHEKMLYDNLIKSINNSEIVIQPLLLPYVLDCDNEQYDYMQNLTQNLKELGFDIKESFDLSFEILAVPNILSGINLNQFFTQLLSDRTSANITNDYIVKEKLAQIACKSAIKAGYKLNEFQIKGLFDQMSDRCPLQCPHGRPAIIEFTRTQLDKLFKRIV